MKVEYLGDIYEFITNHGDIHVFCKQPVYHYSDWTERGSIIVTRYCGDDKFQVLSQLNVNYDGGYVSNALSSSFELETPEYAIKK